MINLFNLSLILNYILSHGSYTKDTSQLDVQHHQQMTLPCMYQYHQHTITRYVSQPCTKPCIEPSTCTISSIGHVPKQVPQTCTNTCTKPCINHAPLFQTVHQSCTTTCTKPCINHAPSSIPYSSTINYVHQSPYQVPTMYINTCTIPCANNVSQPLPYTISLKHAIHHVP
jgi:hypothetical protein